MINVSAIGWREAALSLRATPAQVEKALRRSVTVTLRRTRTTAGREIRKEIALPARYVTDRLKTRNTSTPDAPSGSIFASVRGVLWSRFKHSQLKAKREMGRDSSGRFASGREDKRGGGISIMITPGQRKQVPRAFVFTSPFNGVQIIAVRERGRKQFEVKYGPSPSQVMRTLLPKLQTQADETFDRVFTGELSFIVKGRRR